MKDYTGLVDNAKGALDELGKVCEDYEDAFRQIADLARSMDETNWEDVRSSIYAIAYERY